MQQVIGVVGFKNSGKTTLVEKLVGYLTGLGYSVSTVKHAHHSFDIDHEGRDSFRHRKAGAKQVAVISKERTAIIHELRGDEPPSLDVVLAQLQPCDLVIVEGYKRDAHDKIEVRNVDLAHAILAGEDPAIVAIATNGVTLGEHIPVFDRDDVSALCHFIIRHCSLKPPGLFLVRAGQQHVTAIGDLTRAAYGKWISTIGREPLPMTADYNVAVTEHWIDLLMDNGQLVALIEMVPREGCLFVENLAVAERYQRQGIGHFLLRHCLSLARHQGFSEIRLCTNKAFTANLTYYQNRGLEAFATSPLPDGGEMVCFRKLVS